jgi:hypothetical protein
VSTKQRKLYGYVYDEDEGSPLGPTGRIGILGTTVSPSLDLVEQRARGKMDEFPGVEEVRLVRVESVTHAATLLGVTVGWVPGGVLEVWRRAKGGPA